ncbi:MAG: iron ABC transporter permease [Candidatus Methanomethylophilaceae archaeon]|nr:iron ABC transporter permease [Candidatus Methanomethylophilaceae archaeon]
MENQIATEKAENEVLREQYKKLTGRKILLFFSLIVAVIILIGLSCNISGREMTLTEGLSAIFRRLIGDCNYEWNSKLWWDDRIVWTYIMPRVAVALVAGAGLAAAGTVMQSVLNNPLAEPYTTGVSSGAVFGACLMIIMGVSIATPGLQQYGLVVNAFLFALIPVGIIILLSKLTNFLSPVTMILAGTAISYFFGGLTTLMLVTADENDLASAYKWQVGSLANISWGEIQIIAVFVVLAVVVMMFLTKYLNALTLGDKAAKSLGVDVNKVRTISLLMVALSAAAIVSFTGIIGFVGMLSPHIVRSVIGGDNRFVFPSAMALGMVILLFADTVTRYFALVDIPAGAVMMFIGAPVFLYLMLRKNRGRSWA